MWNNAQTGLFLGFLFLLFLPLPAQDEARKDFIVEAKIRTSQGDTLNCNILYINQYNLQFSLTETDTSGNYIRHYSPRDLSGFTYSISEEINEFTSMTNPDDMGRIFLRKVYEGKYTIYQYLEIDRASSVLSFLASYYIWDDKWLKPAITKQFELESLLYHFSDCQELEYKIKTGEYGLGNIVEILQEYENCELTDEYEYFYE
ncbi:MAG: hypothetical protein JW801_18460 [Bacteroidales bacterium]|nr:hypothetical protein [Bacteroidales bacterium]